MKKNTNNPLIWIIGILLLLLIGTASECKSDNSSGLPDVQCYPS